MVPKRNSVVWLRHLSYVAGLLAMLAYVLAGVDVSAGVTPMNTTGLPLQMPRGFAIATFAQHVGHPSALAWDDKGNMIVASKDGNVYAIHDSNHDGIGDMVRVLATGLNDPTQLSVTCQKNQDAVYAAPVNGIVATNEPPCTMSVATFDGVVTYEYESAALAASAARLTTRAVSAAGVFLGRTALADNAGSCDASASNASVIAVSCGPGNAQAVTAGANAMPAPNLITIPANGWPPGYGGSIVAAAPQSHALVQYTLDQNGQIIGKNNFIGGWLTATGRLLGTPTALLVGPANEPYISDLYIADQASGTIYRVSYKGLGNSGQH